MDNELIYIMGRGHSGSTILDAVLGNGHEAFSMGEIVSGCLTEDDVCSCGDQIKNCEFWNKVKSQFEVSSDHSWREFGEKIKQQAYITKYIPTLLNFNSIKQDEIKKLNQKLVEVVANESGKSKIIDSSKEVTRGLFLAINLDNCKIIHLVRNPYDIFSSNLKRIKEGRFKFLRVTYEGKNKIYLFLILSAFGWVIGNFLAELVKFFSRKKILTVRYESLINNTEIELRRIERYTGVNLGDVIKKVSVQDEMPILHMIAGNGMRRKGRFVFRRNQDTNSLPLNLKIITGFICAPLMFVYGYFK